MRNSKIMYLKLGDKEAEIQNMYRIGNEKIDIWVMWPRPKYKTHTRCLDRSLSTTTRCLSVATKPQWKLEYLRHDHPFDLAKAFSTGGRNGAVKTTNVLCSHNRGKTFLPVGQANRGGGACGRRC